MWFRAVVRRLGVSAGAFACALRAVVRGLVVGCTLCGSVEHQCLLFLHLVRHVAGWSAAFRGGVSWSRAVSVYVRVSCACAACVFHAVPRRGLAVSVS